MAYWCLCSCARRRHERTVYVDALHGGRGEVFERTDGKYRKFGNETWNTEEGWNVQTFIEKQKQLTILEPLTQQKLFSPTLWAKCVHWLATLLQPPPWKKTAFPVWSVQFTAISHSDCDFLSTCIRWYFPMPLSEMAGLCRTRRIQSLLLQIQNKQGKNTGEGEEESKMARLS